MNGPRVRIALVDGEYLVTSFARNVIESAGTTLPPKHMEAVALLQICDDGTELPGVGYKVNKTTFYVEE